MLLQRIKVITINCMINVANKSNGNEFLCSVVFIKSLIIVGNYFGGTQSVSILYGFRTRNLVEAVL